MIIKPTYTYHLKEITYEVYPERPEIENLLYLQQIHSDQVVSPQDIDRENPPAADGFISSIRELHNYTFAIVTADCMPIVALGEDTIAFVHAGWRGVQQDILSPQNIPQFNPHTFFIGPHIHDCCYEVGEEFKTLFPNSSAFSLHNNRTHFSLIEQLRFQLAKNYPTSKIIDACECTHCKGQYHSYRRNQTALRNWNIIRINKEYSI